MTEQVPPDSDDLYQGSQTESGRDMLPPPPIYGTLPEREVWAYRAYHGIGRDGHYVDEMTQKTIANVFGVTTRTVRRWLNNPPVFDELSREDRWLLYGMAITGGPFEEYWELLRLEEESEPDLTVRPEDSEDDDDPAPFGDLDPDFDPWSVD